MHRVGAFGFLEPCGLHWESQQTERDRYTGVFRTEVRICFRSLQTIVLLVPLPSNLNGKLCYYHNTSGCYFFNIFYRKLMYNQMNIN